MYTNVRLSHVRGCTVALVSILTAGAIVAQSRPRARDLGIEPGAASPGALNAITDVAGVRVGHTTLIAGDSRTDRRHGNSSSRGESLSSEGARRGLRG